MKVYACPAEVPFEEPDYKNYDTDRELKREDEHRIKLADWLRAHGYAGEHTGRIAMFPVADGKAMYMIADGPKSCLIHLPYGDAWEYRDIGFLPKKEVIKRAIAREELAEFFKPR